MNDLRSYFDSAMAKFSLSELAIDGNIFSIVKDELWICLQALDAIPRSDPFWTPSNNKATIYKLTEFSQRILAKENNEKAIWCNFSTSVLFGDNGVLSDRAWNTLHVDPRFRIEWVIDIGWWFDAYSGVDTAQWAALTLRRFCLIDQGKEAIAVLISKSDGQKQQWLRIVSGLLEGVA